VKKLLILWFFVLPSAFAQVAYSGDQDRECVSNQNPFIQNQLVPAEVAERESREFKVEKVFGGISNTTKLALCATLPVSLSKLVYDRDFLADLRHKIVLDIAFNMDEKLKKLIGPIHQVELEIEKGEIIIKKMQLTNFTLTKVPGSNKLKGRPSWDTEDFSLSCKE